MSRGKLGRCQREIKRATIRVIMTANGPDSPYALGSSDAEHERLIRQAAHLAPCTERFFRAAGIGSGQHVLDLGSGVGDVAMLVASLVGPSGKVVGVERDPRTIARARARAEAAGLTTVWFTQSDVSQIPASHPFDAAVGRFILQFLPDPVAVLRSLSLLVRPGGVLAFHEPSWAPLLQLSAHLPLLSACASLTHDSLLRSGGNTEMGPALYLIFKEAGLPEPNLQMEVPFAAPPDSAQWLYDLFITLLPEIRRLNLSLEKLGDLNTLSERLRVEAVASNSPVPMVAMIGAWSRNPAS